MPKTAYLFTGQGAQSVGMGRDIAEISPAAAAVFEKAAGVVGYDLRQVCFEGPADRLEQTNIQQPAIFTTSAAIWAAMGEAGLSVEQPAAMAGLSLGEYTALYASGSVSFADALKLVQRRGELMQQAALAVPSGMVSALGLDPGQADEVCRQASGMLVPANYNCPGQIVLSGEKAACEQAVELIEKAGGRPISLKVAGAFHSPIMQPAADELAKVLETTAFIAPPVPVLANVNAQMHGDPASIRSSLTRQLTEPVRWQACIEKLIADGVEHFVEIGPGRVRTGLMKKINRRAAMHNVSTADSLRELAQRAA